MWSIKLRKKLIFWYLKLFDIGLRQQILNSHPWIRKWILDRNAIVKSIIRTNKGQLSLWVRMTCMLPKASRKSHVPFIIHYVRIIWFGTSDDSDDIQNGSFLSLSSRLGSTLVLFLYRAWLLCYPTLLNIGHIKVVVDDHLLSQQSTWKKVLLATGTMSNCQWADKRFLREDNKGPHSIFLLCFVNMHFWTVFVFFFTMECLTLEYIYN
jgi:hypothetical protein